MEGDRIAASRFVSLSLGADRLRPLQLEVWCGLVSVFWTPVLLKQQVGAAKQTIDHLIGSQSLLQRLRQIGPGKRTCSNLLGSVARSTTVENNSRVLPLDVNKTTF